MKLYSKTPPLNPPPANNINNLRRCSSCVAMIKLERMPLASLEPRTMGGLAPVAHRKFTTTAYNNLRKMAKMSTTVTGPESAASNAKDSLLKFRGVMSDFSKAMVKRLRKSLELRKEKKATKLVAIILGRMNVLNVMGRNKGLISSKRLVHVEMF